MLRLKSIPQSPEVVLQFREKERFFNSFFIRAFLIAISFHGIAGMVFSIAPFKITSFFIFSPVQVQSDALALHSTLLTTSADNEITEPFPTPLPVLWPFSVAFTESTFTPSIPLDIHAFESLEREHLPKWTLPSTATRESAVAQLFMAGELADRFLHELDDRIMVRPLLEYFSIDSPYSIAYQVKMEQSTGKIFWYERVQTSGIAKLDELTKHLLLSLQFSRNESLNIASGTILFIINEKFLDEQLNYD